MCYFNFPIMHELFTQVLSKKDLSKAGDLFSVPDGEIVNDLTEVLTNVLEITSSPDYINSDNDQSVVEICITRITSALRDTESMERHADAVVALLQSCLNHSLKPTGQDEDPPHAKIAADIISAIFLNYNKKEVMKKALPVAVKFLHKGNKELSRNLSSYLSLAGIENAQLLAQHIQLIIDSIISGNYTLSRVLPQVYAVDKEALEDHAMALVSLLPLCEDAEKLALLNLFALIASNKPSLLEPCLPQLREYLTQAATASACMQVFLNLAERRPQSLLDHLASVKTAAARHPATLCLAAKVISSVGKLSKDRAQEALNFVLEHLPKADRGSQSTLLREATLLCSSYPVLFTEKMLQEVRQVGNTGLTSTSQNQNSQMIPTTTTTTSGNVTIVKLGGGNSKSDLLSSKDDRTGSKNTTVGPRPRSTIRLDTTPHRSMTRLNGGGSRASSVGGLHKSMTRLSSSQQIHQQGNLAVQVHVGRSVGNTPICSQPAPSFKVISGGVTVLASGDNCSPTKSITGSRDETRDCRDMQVLVTTTQTPFKQSVNVLSPVAAMTQSSGAVTHRRIHHTNNNNNVTVISNHAPPSSQRMSVFEPYPMRDTVQHFCEKHLDKIKAYMEKVSLQIPPPAKCTIEERRAKKLAKLDFACQGRGEHCLYKRTFFTMRTRNPRTWIHLMFLALQAKSSSALSSRDASVSSLKHCWDMLKCESKTFLTVVTSAFPCAREQEALLAELRANGFQDVLGLVRRPPPEAPMWVCFLCNHPEKAQGFLQDSQPVIEGQLKEKKGKWKIFKRWRTRYFTLSGAHLSYKISKDDTDVAGIDVKQIRSVKVSRGARNIPKAFEIFTGDRSLILKPKGGKNAEEWVQCLNAVVAHSQTRDTTIPNKTHSLPARTAV